MKIQIASDLHLEFPENRKWIRKNPLIPQGDVLILAGDIIYDNLKKTARFFYKDIGNKFKHVIRVPGNHEFYDGTINYIYPSYKKEFMKNHYKINNNSIIIDDVKFIVSTLWSFIPDEEMKRYYRVMNDYRYIFKYFDKSHKNIGTNEKFPIHIHDTNYYHEISVKFLKRELKKKYDGKIIIITHHLPSFKFINKPSKVKYKFSYASQLDNLIEENHFDLWIFGHRHKTINTRLYNKRFVSNPLGYMDGKQKFNFRRDLFFEI